MCKLGTSRQNVGTLLQQFVALSFLWAQSFAQVYNLSLSIEEGLPARTVVGDLKSALAKPSSGFFISESRDSYVFKDLEIDAETGIISTATVLDRESRDKYGFVAATLTGEMIAVKIMVKDVNDNSPVFSAGNVQLNVSELSPPGTRFELEGAKDRDEGDFGTQGYRIADSEMRDLFKVEYRHGGETLSNPDLILTHKLDRETRDTYSLAVEAFDGGIPPKTGLLHVYIRVLDENDNPPVFNQTEYHASVREDAPAMTPVCQVHATDLDLGDNGLIAYEINRRQSDPNEVFAINATTGVIHVKKPLDFEARAFYELIVRARDNGARPEYGSAVVRVKVLDVNDNSPSINILFLSETGDPEVSEWAAVGEYVARISVADPDLGEGERVRVNLEGGGGKFALKQTDDFLHALCVAGELDREEEDLYELKVVASDFGVPPLRSEVTFAVKVTDANDCRPTFDESVYAVVVAEDAPPGTSLVQVRARDADDGVNAAVRYSVLKSSREPLVTVDPASGLVATATWLDRERESEVRFLVVAVDGGEPPLSSTATVAVVIEDVNDNEPVFRQQLYNVSVPEHTEIGICFLQVIATDADGSDFGSVCYSLSDGFDKQDGHPLFNIDPETGELCVSQDIDRDAGPATHDVLVKAEDQGGLSAQTYVHIEVEDLNDNRPVFNPERYATSVSSHAQPGTEILNVIASDRDLGTFGHVTYELIPGDLSTLFSVDESTGVVYLTSTLTHLGTASVKLAVQARDGEGLTSARPAEVTVNVLRSARAPAVFQRSRYAFTVPEDTPPGSSVGVVEAINPANSVESLSYRISSGDPQGLFTVHPHSGLISTRQALDHESQPYALLVLQSHSDASPVYSSTQVNVTVADVNDNAPVFPRAADAVAVSQNTLPGTVLFIAHAHDADSGANGRVRYSIPPGAAGGNGAFAVDAELGAVSLNRSLARDSLPRYAFEILARDEGAPSLTSTMTLAVDVDRAAGAEDALAFETLVYQVEIGEGTHRDARVIQVRAHRSRRRSAAPGDPGLSYSLEPEPGFPPPPFRIHPDSGWLYLSQSLDYETEPVFRFRVFAAAKDVGQAGEATPANGTAAATVVALVLDENDNAPAFSERSFFFTVPEGPSPQGLVGTVRAADKDSGKNAQLSYILLSDGKHFRIDAKTGELINWVSVDRERQGQHTLKVMVTDQGRPRLNATAAVHILVTDLNDNPPRFTHLPAGKELNVQVCAGLPAGTLVISMFAKDQDSGDNGTVQFSLLTEDDLGHFEIDSGSGDIRTTWRFSQNARAHYTLTVVASDCGHPSLEERAVIHLQVHATERQSGGSEPQGVRHFSVREDAKPGTVIGSVQLPANGKMRYSIAEGDGSLHFGVDSASGDLYLQQPLDYEAATRYFLVVRAEDAGLAPGLNGSAFVSVTVEDVNDHSPWFSDEVLTFGLREDTAVGAHVFTFDAKDGDGSFPNSALRYSLAFDPELGSGSSTPLPFSIHPLAGTLTLTAALDRERTQSFAFVVTATDQAERAVDRKRTSVTAQVFLLDVNDESPVFVSADTARVAEDGQVGSLVHHVLAVDADLGDSGLVTYSLLAGNEMRLFTLEEKTGLLYLASPLDYESQTSHRLTVQAQDRGLPSLSSTQNLTLEVGDVNDQPPVFQQQVYAATVPENRGPGEPVVKVSAADKDSAENAVVSYSLLPGPGYEFFAINPHTGLISTAAPLDREQHQRFILRVQGRDSGLPSLSGVATVVCSVLDDNDNAPEFMQASFRVSLPENLPPGVVHTVQASDPDHGDNGTVRYAIQGDDYDGRFVVDAATGAVRATRPLDREERGNYTLTLVARDAGPSPLGSSTRLELLVLDENDNSPAFARQSYRAAVREGLPAGAEVLRLSALDPDEGPNGEVTYSLAEDSLGGFSVDASSGVIRTTRTLDRESRARYALSAVATDGSSSGPRSSAVSVAVQVEDVNDNAPVCARNPVSVWVAADTPTNRTVAAVVATDDDRGENGTVRFSLAEEEEGGGVFDVGRESGEIRLRVPLGADFSEAKLRVLAVDQGRAPLTSTCLVLVQLKGAEERLQFKQQDYQATVAENSRAGTWVVKVEALDRTGEGQKVAYSIFSGNENGAFAVDPNTGDISVRQQESLDHETSRQAQLVLLAESGLRTAHCRVTVALQDANDNAPAFEQSYYRTAVWEGQVRNTYVMQVFASDADSGVNSQVDFSILSGNNNDAFIVDSVRGILATNAVLDREITSSYKLVLQATDRGSPPLTATATVRVQVVDVNDNSPTIPLMEPVVIAENLPAGYIVTQVSANDADLSPAVTYSFADNRTGAGGFAIDPYTGLVTLTRTLDHEEQTEHTLRVWASDSLHQTAGEVRVHVLDVNDNAPVFSQDSYQAELPELASASTLVLTVSATDKDSGLNGKVTYRLLSSPLRGFYIHPDNGSVFISKPVKYVAEGDAIRLLVEARDAGDPVRSAVASVDILVLDANDHAPVFARESYSVAAPEDTPVGATLLTLSADDGDSAPENARLDYVITAGNDERRFCMEVGATRTENRRERTVGRLVLCNPLDREATESYAVTVTARDRGSPPLSGSAVVAVTVSDVNDNAPVFAGGGEYRARVSEGAPAGTRLVQVTARDRDRGANGTVRYDVVSGDAKGRFRLDARSGVLEVNGSLDYEEDAKYALTVRASDGGAPGERQAAFAVVFVAVSDENDNSPYFAFPVVNCSVPENLPAFSPVCSVHAVDADAGPYGVLAYSILSSCFADYSGGGPDATEPFAVDPLTGAVRTRRALDYERRSEYCFAVEARDEGGKAATARVQVAVEGVDEFSPVFTRRHYRFLLPEDAGPGATVGHVTAMDHDGGADGLVEYSLAEPSSPFFAVDKATGAVLVAAAVYRRRGGLAADELAEVRVSAGGPRPGSRSSTALVTVDISAAAELRTGVPLGVQTASLAASLAVFLLLLVSFAALVLRCKTREAAVDKAAAAATTAVAGGTFRGSGGRPRDGIGMRDLRTPAAAAKRGVANPYRTSKSSSRGSAEGETAEDQEIKMTDGFPRRGERAGSVQSDTSLGIPDPDRLSRLSIQLVPGAADRAATADGRALATASTESLHNFKEEGGGEGMLPRARDAEESAGQLSDSRVAVDGSRERLGGGYCSWDYLLDWETPRLRTPASDSDDLSLLPDEELQGGREGLAAAEAHDFWRPPSSPPPPLLTRVARPGARAVPPRVPQCVHALGRRPSYPKYAYSPLAWNTGIPPPSAMTPGFSPTPSVLTVRTPNASPVVSETGLGSARRDSLTASLLEAEIQM